MSLMKILLLFILWKSSNALLIRPINVYQNIIAGMHERYKFDALTILHGHTHYNPYEDIELSTKLVKLQIHFARLLIPTAVMSIELFKIQEMPRMDDFQKPFFVFLNDFDDLKNQLTPELLTSVAKSERVSLIFFRDKTKAEKFFENMHIPLNCQFMVSQRNQSDEKNEIITEIYRFSKHDKLKQDFLTSWNPVTGMQLPKMFLHHRRKNLRGHNINVGWVENWSIKHPLHSKKLENGIGVHIINALQKELELNVTSHRVKKMGDCYDNNTCTHAVGKLVSKKLDMIGQPVSTFRNLISNNYVDYSMTCFVARKNVYYQKPPNSFKWMIYKKLFQHDVWTALGIHMLMTSIAIIFIEYKKKVMYLGKKLKNLIPLNVSDICFRAYTMLINQSVPYSKYNQIQILQFTTYVLFIVIYAVYSAKLVSFLAADQEEIPFNSIKELILNSSYEVGVVKDSEIYYRAKELMNQPNYEYLKPYFRYESLPRNSWEGFYRVCENQQYALIEFDFFANFFKNVVNNSCEIREKNTVPYHFSFILQKNNPLKRYINRILIKSKEYGIYKPVPFYFKENLYSKSISAIDMPHVLPSFIFLGIFMLLSIIILFCEIGVHKLKLKQFRPVKSKRIWNIIKSPSKGINKLRRRTLKAKHRRGKKRYNRRH